MEYFCTSLGSIDAVEALQVHEVPQQGVRHHVLRGLLVEGCRGAPEVSGVAPGTTFVKHKVWDILLREVFTSGASHESDVDVFRPREGGGGEWVRCCPHSGVTLQLPKSHKTVCAC